MLDMHAASSNLSAPTKVNQPTLDVWKSMGLDSFLSPTAIELKAKCEKMIEDNLDELTDHYGRGAYPAFILPKLRELGIAGMAMKDFGGLGLSTVDQAGILMGLGGVSSGPSTFIVLHTFGMNVIDQLGSDEMRQRILPEAVKFNKILCFALSEPDYGSDATSLETYAKKVSGGYILNGQKRWIGNSTVASYIIVWAKNKDDGNRI